MEIEELGERIETHHTDSPRRLRVAVSCLVVAAVSLGVGIPLTIAHFQPWGPAGQDPRSWVGSGMLPGALTTLGVLALGAGILTLLKYLRTKDEYFEVHRQGMIHHVSGATSVIRWSDVASVRPKGAVSDRGGARHFGADFSCLVVLTDGRRIRFNTFIEDAPQLAEAIVTAVDPSARS
ncbi:hypothetical protein [Actinoalloteichus fjordicus]|uniref:Uncharacterized protein n=1 Tax=Actinoalloteichus fjordicus TaxID=1612552 RepID=A0AAC9PTW3_9PSEU|nr:hypothetical protein [Actinoalloteichus fjordicus]APU16430.1 hypothetical protein UA74_22060 [Actinoalloteichus fjordicus]